MSKATVIRGLYGATRPRHWPALTSYLASSALARLSGSQRHRERVVTFRPFKVSLDVAGKSGLVFLHEIVTSRIYDLEPARDQSVRVLFDAGANCGFFSLRHACANPQLRVFCFEPHPQTFEKLRRNVEVNGLVDRVTPVHAAVGATSGQCEIVTSTESSMAQVATASVQFLDQPVKATVPLVTLDQIAAEKGVWPDYIKIDVEGFEVEVLRGSTACLQRAKWVVLEYHSPELQHECTRLLREASYHVEVLPNGLLLGRRRGT